MAQDPRWTKVHRDARAAALAALVDGTPCPLCGEPMDHGQRLQLDHVTPVVHGGLAGAGRLTHGSCNERAGQRLGQAIRRAASADPQAVAWAVDSTAHALADARRRAASRPASTW